MNSQVTMSLSRSYTKRANSKKKCQLSYTYQKIL